VDDLVSTAWLESHLGEADLRILAVPVRLYPDPAVGAVTEADEWAQAHIPGSVLADLPGRLSDRSNPLPAMMPPAQEFAAAMEELGVGEGTRVVLYDLGGNAWAARVWWMLHAVGFDDAAVLDGGWRKWELEARPVSNDVTDPPTAHFVVKEERTVFVGTSDVQTALEDGSTCVINALDAAQHSGEVPYVPTWSELPTPGSFYGIAGHIPGTSNVPYLELVDPDTTAYLPEDELRRRLETALASERVVMYCGAGIAASSDAFLLRRLGHRNVTVYDGSLVEWFTNELPLVTES
jgi:thiosulfate/3-mercaptopyruvate sulfurtransferase